jgi:D-alanyl-D-alanine carboxypeptidase
MSVAESVVIEAAIRRDARHAHRVNTKAAHMTDAEAAAMRATNDTHVGTSKATDMTAAKTATAAREGGTTSRRYSNQRGCGDCENFAVNLSFHDPDSFFLASNQSWAMKGGISNIDWCLVRSRKSICCQIRRIRHSL